MSGSNGPLSHRLFGDRTAIWHNVISSLFQMIIKEQLQESHGMCEYAVYVQGMPDEGYEKNLFVTLKYAAVLKCIC